MKQSPGPIGKMSLNDFTFERMLEWVSMTPFGSPVLPLENTTVASGPRSVRICDWVVSKRRYRRELRPRRCGEFGGGANRARGRLRETPSTASAEIGLLEESARRNDGPYVGSGDGGVEGFAARREVEVDRDAADEEQGQVGQDRTRRCGQHGADHRLVRGQPAERAAERDGRRETRP